MTRRRLAIVAAAALAVVAGAPLAERVGAHSIVDAPNRGRPAPPPLADERRVAVGPPAAELAIAIVDPPSGAPRGTIFLLHGIRSHKESLAGWARHVADGGYRAILVDSRGHGRSSGDWLSYGVLESRDLSQLVDALAPPAPIGVMGASYGAATALEWAGREPRVRAAVAVAPFSSLREVVPVYTPRMVPLVGRFLPRWLVERTVDAAGRMGGFDPDLASPLDAIALRPVPILIFHGTSDAHIPIGQSEALQAHAADHVRLVKLDGADHLHIAGDARLWPAALDFFAGAFTKER